jgi:hypothetical protein
MKLNHCLFFILMMAGLNIYGQQSTVCGLQINDAPVLRGFSLQTTKSEIQKIFPKVKITEANKFGVSSFMISFFPVPDRIPSFGQEEAPNSINTEKFPAFKGIDSIEFEMLDNKVSVLKINYDGTTKWRDHAEFIERISETLKLPKSWKYPKILDDDFKLPFLECAGFTLEANLIGGNGILKLTNNEALKIISQRKLADEENRKKEFKP